MCFNKLSKTLTLAGLLSVIAPPGQAVEVGGIDFKGSGFLTLAAGAVLNSGDAQSASGYNCPCFISSLADASVYEKGGVKWMPDSKLGLQGTATFNERYSLTSQIVARGADGGNVDMEWLYGSIRFNDKLTLQIGRKRLPLFYYSELQDVGQSYPWVHLSQQLYGWEIVNYNGANLYYEDQWGNWSSGINFFTGSETVKDNGFWKLYNGKNNRTDSRWSNIAGTYISLNNDWFEGRLLYIQSKMQDTTPPDLTLSDPTRQKIYGISFNADYAQWIARSEFLYINRKESYGGDHAQLYGLGYRFGKFLPMVTYTNYRQSVLLDQTEAEAHSTTSLVLRYNLSPSSAIKLQYDHWQSHAQPNFIIANPDTASPSGTVKLLSASYDVVF